MIVFRLSKKEFVNDLSGKGAELAGGRWNSIGNAILYTAQNRALCTAEIAVHTPLGIIPENYFLVSIETPKRPKMQTVKKAVLGKSWKSFPHSDQTKKIGDIFLKQNRALILKVPSAVIQGEFNYLINPKHQTFDQVKVIHIEPFEFYSRLFK